MIKTTRAPKIARLTEKEKRRAVAVLLRSSVAWKAIAEWMREHDLPDADRAYSALLAAARAFWAKANVPPPQVELTSALEAAGLGVYGDELEIAHTVLKQAYAPGFLAVDLDSPALVAYAKGVVQRWMNEATVWKLQGLLDDPAGVPANLSSLLADQAKYLDAAPEEDAFSVPFPADWQTKPGIVFRKTGVPVFDSCLMGGDAAGEVYGVMGPFGSWKTLNATQMVGEAVRQAAATVVSPDWDGRWPFASLVSYEAKLTDDVGLGELRIRLLCYLARVRKDRLEKAEDLSKDLSRTGCDGDPKEIKQAYQDYERELFASEFAMGDHPVPGEYERVLAATALLNRHLAVFDLSRGGSGWVPEVEGLMERFLESRRHRYQDPYFNFFYLDYASLMCKRHTLAKGLDRHDTTDLINRTPDAIRAAIGNPFRVPCWLNNQLSGEANARKPTATISHADAGGCRSWGENLDFSFILYKPDGAGIGRFDCDKHRRAPPRREAIIQVDGAFSRVIDVSDEYEMLGGRFVEKEAAEQHVDDKFSAKVRRAASALT